MRVDEFFGWAVESHDETDGIVRINCRSSDGRRMVVEAKRLIKAYGFEAKPNDPLEISSERILSVSPDFCDMRCDEMRASDTPVWIIGGGKTAMDTAHALITEYPGREVNLVAGSGTYFLNRDRLLPTGAGRWWRGKTFSSLALEVTRRFDGTNEADVKNWFRDTYGTWLTPETGNFFVGLLSESENKTIAAGLNDVIMDHLVDVVDRNGSTELVFRSGSAKAIQPGSWIVNCTGYFKYDDRPYEPYASPSGAVLSIQPRSMTLQLTSVMGYFMTHLLMLDKIRDIPLYELDAMELRNKSNAAFPFTLFTLALYNLSLITGRIPNKAFADCGIDVNRWYPLPRRMVVTRSSCCTHRREREHQRCTSTPCATGSTFGRPDESRRSPRQIEELAAGWAANQSSSRSAIVSGCSSRIQCETPFRTSKRYSPTTYSPQARAPFSSNAISPSLQTNIVGTVTFLPVSRGSRSVTARYQLSAASARRAQQSPLPRLHPTLVRAGLTPSRNPTS